MTKVALARLVESDFSPYVTGEALLRLIDEGALDEALAFILILTGKRQLRSRFTVEPISIPKLESHTNINEYFQELQKLPGSDAHTILPLLAFTVTSDRIRVEIVNHVDEPLALSDETLIVGQQHNDQQSEYFQFSVGKYRTFIERNER